MTGPNLENTFLDDSIHDAAATSALASSDPWREAADDSRKDYEFHANFVEEKERELEKGSLDATLDKGGLGTTLATLAGSQQQQQVQTVTAGENLSQRAPRIIISNHGALYIVLHISND